MDRLRDNGYVALANNNLTYPAIAMGTNGKGVIAFTVVGADYYPSAGYVTINAQWLCWTDPHCGAGLVLMMDLPVIRRLLVIRRALVGVIMERR